MTFEFNAVWQPKARRAWLKNHPEEDNWKHIPGELEWKDVPSNLLSFIPQTPEDAKRVADQLSLDQACDVHVWSSMTPGELFYHSYADGRKGDGWPR